jgi:hypothetical protein
MASTIEYALMAGASYYDTRAEINRFPVPDGWLEKAHVPNNPDYPMFTATSGFEAVSFQNIANPNEIVISFAGTGPGSILSADWVNGNIPLALGNMSDQLRQAANNRGQTTNILKVSKSMGQTPLNF